MKEIKGTPAVLVAAKGKKLTQADDAVGLSERIVTDRVYLAVTDSAERWKEITAEEADEIVAAQAEAYNKPQNMDLE